MVKEVNICKAIKYITQEGRLNIDNDICDCQFQKSRERKNMMLKQKNQKDEFLRMFIISC